MTPLARQILFAFSWWCVSISFANAQDAAAPSAQQHVFDSDVLFKPASADPEDTIQRPAAKKKESASAADSAIESTETDIGPAINGGARKANSTPPKWSGSSISVGQAVSTLSFDPSAELDYNPYYAVTLGIAPNWAWNQWVYTSARLSLSREITQANARNRGDEIWLSDTSFTVGYTGYTVPVLGIRIASDLTGIAPTSPPSKAQTSIFGFQLAVSVSKRLSLLSGLNLSYRGSARLNLHQYTTSELVSPRIADCRGETCAQFINTGVRNSQYQQGHNLNLGLSILDWLTVTSGVGVYLSHLYDSAPAVDTEYSALTPMDTRYAISYSVGTTVALPHGVSASLGLSTFNPQRAPNNTFYRPFYNRFSQVFLDLRFRPSMWFQN